jgi:hypothetical protein
MEQPPPILETPPPATPKEPTMSLTARLMNVFAVPGEVFEEIKATRASVANWLVPAAIASVVGALAAIVMFSQPSIRQQIREKQEQAFEQQIKAGKMTREQADQAMVMVEKFTGPTMMAIFGSVGAVVASFVRLFWWGLVLWLLGRWFLKARFNYLKAVEVAGLASMITVLGMIVSILLIVNMGKMFSTLSLGLAVSDFDETKKSHLMLGAVNVFNFWLIGVLGAGLARLAGVPFLRAALLVLGYWLVVSLLLILIGLGTFVL